MSEQASEREREREKEGERKWEREREGGRERIGERGSLREKEGGREREREEVRERERHRNYLLKTARVKPPPPLRLFALLNGARDKIFALHLQLRESFLLCIRICSYNISR